MSFMNSQHLGFLSAGSRHDELESGHHDDRIGHFRSANGASSILEDADVVAAATVQDGDSISDEDEQRALFRELFLQTEAKIVDLFARAPRIKTHNHEDTAVLDAPEEPLALAVEKSHELVNKRPTRNIDEDDYDDEDEEDLDHVDGEHISPSKARSAGPLLSPSKSGSSPIQSDRSPIKPECKLPESNAVPKPQPKTSEDARRQLEESKKATEDAVKRSFHTMFYTLENDRGAMLEQQKLEDSEKAIDADLDHGSNANHAGTEGESHGTLSSANLGASSLTLKHLIARIDLKRDRVKASDAELRTLMNEVRKNRSKWASEENVGQEELYEAAEKVLSELKALTEYSSPFLTRVNKREAPDYYNIIKTPMDLGTMTKKLKTLVYKSKAEFVADLDLIWSNCLKYNGEISHPLRRNANSMRKEAEKLVPLIPDLAIRPRAEVEAEERRKQNGDDAGEESDDEPIMSSRGRKAPSKTGTKGVNKTRKSTSDKEEGTPLIDQKPVLHLNGLLGVNHDVPDIGRESSFNGFATPPVAGSVTPGGLNGLPGSQADLMDIDGPSINGIALGQALGVAAEDLQEDEEFRVWKQVTKKDRALVAKERNRLFRGDRVNADEPALLRSKAGMRRWLRLQKQAQLDEAGDAVNEAFADSLDKHSTQAAETLAEGMEGEEERVLPDYYDALSAVPDIPKHLQWIEDDKGQVIDQVDHLLHMVPRGMFVAPKSILASRIDANMRQMQETRKVCSKIGIVKQMQLQNQMYTNQFQKYDPSPFVEEDIEPYVVSDDGPIMSPWVCRAALQRSVARICYHAGFEEFQPSAMDVITDLAGDFFEKMAKTFNTYREAPKVAAIGYKAEAGMKLQERFTNEEVLLHCLAENGLDIDVLEGYARDDNERFGTKLTIMHERMKAHLTDLLRPALVDAGTDGVGAFNDGSEQFVGGDFAEDLDEDFFGFKELGLDKELGLANLSVPLHLLQSRVHNAHAAQQASSGTAVAEQFGPVVPLPPVTVENIQEHIGLIKNFFLAKLHANNDEPLIEDEDLPIKQRFPKPRLPPTGKITSPRKRPLKEQISNAKKKKKLENGMAMDISPEKVSGKNGSPEKGKGDGISPKKLKLSLPNGGSLGGHGMERVESSQGNGSPTERDDASVTGMMSPESLER